MAKTTTAETTQTAEVASTVMLNDPDKLHYMEYVPDAETGVIEAESYHFGEYQPGKELKLEGDIEHLFTRDFTPDKRIPYEFVWALSTKLADVGKKYFTPVKKEIHSKWFKPSAFNPQNGLVECGTHPATGKKELTLVVRSAKAAFEEKRQMLSVSQMAGGNDTRERSDTGQAKYGAAIDSIHNGYEKKYVRAFGEGLTTSRKNPWQGQD